MGLSPTLMLQKTMVSFRLAVPSQAVRAHANIESGARHVELSGPGKREQLKWRQSSGEGQRGAAVVSAAASVPVCQLGGALWSRLSFFSRPEASAGRRVDVRACNACGKGAWARGRPGVHAHRR